MPKEITHFALASELGRSMPGTTLFRGPVKEFPTLFLLGAVAPDIPFFYQAGRNREGVQNLSVPFHRTDALALEPVLDFLARDSSPPALALAAGVVCHLLSDTHFHPLVYYYTGMDGVHPGATGRHRTFETAMDLQFWFLFRGETRLNRVVGKLEVSEQTLCRLLNGLFRPGPALPGKAVLTALNQFKKIQFLFRASIVRNGLAWMNQKGRPLPEKISGLAYPFTRPVALPFFTGPMGYRDPCTQESESTNLSTMINQTLESVRAALDIISAALAKQRVETALDHPDLPRIRPALPPEEFKIWHGMQDIRPLVYQGLLFPF